MKKHNWFKWAGLFLWVNLITIASFAQQGDILITVGNEKVTKKEFEYVFKKNNMKQSLPASEKTLREYLDLYINFRLKVMEAKSMGMDTSQEFKKELSGYRKQLAAPYLTDKEVTDKLMHEAYERSQKEIKASHILIMCKEDALPKDTLAAYNKIMNIRKRIVDKGEDFGKLAEQLSEDKSAKQNKGNLGYFTVFSMVYPFETAAYNGKVGGVSMPIRTKYGYHLLKVTDTRPAQGEVRAAHIMIRTSAGMTKEDSLKAKAKIDEISNKLQSGSAAFEDLAKQYSDDKTSAKQGGVLPPFTTGRMVPEFENEVFSLKKMGDYSKPFQTAYGWHIAQLLDRKPIPTFDESKNELKNRIARDSRSELNKQSFVKKLKTEYKFTENLPALKTFYKATDSAIYKSKFKETDAVNPNDLLFTIDGNKYYIKDYSKHVVEHQINLGKENFAKFKDDMYNFYVNKSLMDYEESKLENKYPDFKALIEEYRDGILLFELTDQKVWSAAVKDTSGLESYYKQNANNYMWGDRLDATIYTCANESTAATVRKLMKNKKISEDSLLRRMNKENPLNLTIKTDKFEKGDNTVIDGIEWKKGITPNKNVNNTVVFVNVRQKINSQPKTLNEVRGTVTADYQNYLEKQWINLLRSKYSVKVNEDVFRTLLK